MVLLTGCLDGEETPEGEDGNNQTTDDGSDEDTGNRTENGEDGEMEDQDGEEEGEDTEDEERRYTRFMYDPEQAGVSAERYVFSYTGTDASGELSERIQGTTDTAGELARIAVRSTSAQEEADGELPEERTRETVSVRVYEQEASFDELTGSLTESTDSYAGYDVYERAGLVLGVNEERLAVVEGPTTERVRLVAETLEGETPSYAESNDGVGVLTDAAGTGDAVLVRGGLPDSEAPGVENALASAAALSEESGNIEITFAVVYPDEESTKTAVSTDSMGQDPPEDTEAPSDGLTEEPPEGSEGSSDELTPLLAVAVTELNLGLGDVDVSDQTTVGRVAVLEASVERSAFFGGL